MKQGYYIHENLRENGQIKFPGVQSKIDGQLNEMKKICVMQEIELHLQKKTIMNLILRRLPWTSRVYCWNGIMNQIKDPAFIYIRWVFPDHGMMRFFKDVRKKYPDVKILLEIPTFPYDKEQFGSIKAFPLLIKDHHNRKRFKKYIDRIVLPGRIKDIFGIETIGFKNGIDIQKIPVRERITEQGKAIRLIAVASFQEAHGYERIIEGLYNYICNGGTREIYLCLVGDGNELEKYRELVEKYNTQKWVTFVGRKQGNELDEQYNKADIGLDAFGFYKRDIDLSSSLKSREYLARGLPFIGGTKLDLFIDNPSKYYLEFSNNSEPIDMKKVIDFYTSIYETGKSYEEVISDIREYAERTVTWEKTFDPVIRYLDSVAL